MGPPLFSRSPRLRPEVSRGEVEIPAPPPRPPAPAFSVAWVLAMLLPALLGGLLAYGLMRGRGMGSPYYLLLSLPMVLVSAAVQVGLHLHGRRQHRRAVAAREARYREALAAAAARADEAASHQRELLWERDPSPALCVERAVTRDTRLWERSPVDPDFLALRLGSAGGEAALQLIPPREPPVLDADPDPLLAEARTLTAALNRIRGLPLRLPLREAGPVGVVGEGAVVRSFLRALIIQVAVHHAPTEVKLAALFDQTEGEHWAWLRWLPHSWDEGHHRRWLADGAGGAALLARLQGWLPARPGGAGGRAEGAAEHPWLVLLLAAPALAEGHPLLPQLLREGAARRAVVIIQAERLEGLPQECRVIIQLGPDGGELLQTLPALTAERFQPDTADLHQADWMARHLAPLRLWQMAAPAPVPARVTLLDLLGVRRVEGLDLLARWQGAEPFRTLAVPLGRVAGGAVLWFDLHERGDGPHGLVAGATGSGKSELLQSLIAALAVYYHPHELALVLVDYKGGGMAGAFQGLPHLAGTITNLQEQEARRALAALKAELKRRQRLLGGAGVTHVDDYLRLRRRGRSLEPLPHLLVIVDEFAELKVEQPQFIRELVSAVRVGRSLGIHLILATQKPAGVVDEQIWSNSRFRLCLRVERPEDSHEVLRSPEAATVTGAGRAYCQVGNRERFELFQAAWGGAPYSPDSAGADPDEIARVALDGSRHPLGRPRLYLPAGEGRSELAALVDWVAQVAAGAGIDPVPSPWLPPLPVQVELADLLAGGPVGGSGLAPVVGLVDDPDQQAQGPLVLDLEGDGHLLLYGAPGSGKSSFLISLATALALTYPPDKVHIYAIDGAGRVLRALADLPHVGGVLMGEEAERVQRLLAMLLAVVEERKRRFADLGVTTLAAYRQGGGEPLPALVLLVDGLPALLTACPDQEEPLAQLAREGGSLGVHLVLTASAPGQVRPKVAANITLTAALQLADRADYALVVGRTDGLEPAPVPGRGLIRGRGVLQFQTARAAPGGSDWERAAALRRLGQVMAAAWSGPLPAPVRALPDRVSLVELLQAEDREGAGDGLVLGLEAESLAPFRLLLAAGPHFLVTGPPESGKTSLLHAVARSLAAAPPEGAGLYLLDLGLGGLAPLRGLDLVRGYAADPAEAERLVEALAAELAARRARRERAEAAPLPGPLVLLLDDADGFRETAPPLVRDRLEQLLRRERGLGLHLFVAGAAGAMQQLAYEGVVRAVREQQTGFLLGSTDHSDLQLLGLRLPGESGRLLPPGLGYFARRGRWRKVKIGLWDPEDGKGALS